MKCMNNSIKKNYKLKTLFETPNFRTRAKLKRQLQEVNVNQEQAHLPKHAYSSTSNLTTTNKIMPPLIANTNQKPPSILWLLGLVNHKEIGYLKPVHFALTNSRISTLPQLEFYDHPERKKDMNTL